MNARFRPAHDSHPRSNLRNQHGSTCRCCAARERALALGIFDSRPEWHSPLTPGVLAGNLSSDGGNLIVRVILDDDWPRMLKQLPTVGPGLLMSRNEAAILGCWMPYPRLYFTNDQKKGASAEAGLWLESSALVTAHALHLRHETTHLFSVEFTGASGSMLHGFSLTPESDLDAFCDWVRLHQACGFAEPRTLPVDEDAAISARRCENWQTLNRCAVLALVSDCLRYEIAVCATVYAGAVRQRALFTPRSLQPTDDWWFASDEKAGLHFCSHRFRQVRLAPPRDNAECAAPVLIAETVTHSQALILELGDSAQCVEWNSIVHAIVHGLI